MYKVYNGLNINKKVALKTLNTLNKFLEVTNDSLIHRLAITNETIYCYDKHNQYLLSIIFKDSCGYEIEDVLIEKYNHSDHKENHRTIGVTNHVIVIEIKESI